MEIHEIAPGLWRWVAAHPEWTPDEGGAEGWVPDVGSVYYEAPDGLVLIDPLAPPEGEDRDRFWRALDRDVERLGRPPDVLLTVYWHARSAQEVLDRYEGARLWAYEPGTGPIGERVRFTDTFALGDPLPGAIQAIDAHRRDEVLFWLPDHRALVSGDVLLGTRDGGVRVCPDSWLPDGVDPTDFRAGLRPLLELPVERVLVSHGEPVLENGHEALARALAAD
jgi:glyoxylase-like metal-dependent hydrolase (beta-lactamase superfamily II)